MAVKTATLGNGSGLLTLVRKRQVSNEAELPSNFDANHYYACSWRNRSWNTLPNWKTLLESQGYLPTQSYTDDRRLSKIVGGGKMRFRLKTNSRNGWNVDSDVALEPAWNLSRHLVPTFDPDLTLDAKNKALQKAKQQRINLSVAVAEGRSTVQMLTKTVVTLGEAYGSFRKGRFKAAARRLNIGDIERSLANNWLSYRLGWLPLVSDAVGLVDLHRDQFSTERLNRFIVRASKQKVSTSIVEERDFVVTGNHGLLYRTDVMTARVGMLLEVTSKLDQFQASVGLSSGDILSTAWELVPFSFVFDYFVDVGSWLGNLTALNGIKVVDAWQIQETSRTVNLDASASPNSLYVSNHPNRFWVDRHFVRSPWAPGSLTWPRTRSITDQSAIRLTTMAALFSQLYRGDPKIGKFRPKPAREE